MIVPCIDLMDGKAVQLVQGKAENKKIEIDDIDSLIEKFKDYTINVIDLDAALGKGDNKETIRYIASKIRCRVGGGIRTVEKAQEALSYGCDKIIIGSAIFSSNSINFDFLKELTKKINPKNIIIAIDVKNNKIVTKGWTESTQINVFDVVKELEPYCSEFLCTYVDKEGLMQGTDLELFKRLRKLTKNDITAAGGISSQEEIDKLEKLNVNSALGMALYSGKIKLD